MGFIAKLLKWIPLNVVSIIGIVQAVIKFLKEVLTAIVNILFPIIPSAKFQGVVLKVRQIVEVIDSWFEKIKGYLLKLAIK